MPLSKKVFIFSSVGLIILLLFWGIYNLSFKPSSKTQTPKTADNSSASTASVKVPAKISTLTDESITSPFLTTDNNIKYYSKETGKTYQISLDGTNKKVLSDTALPGLVIALWSPDGTKVISKFIRDGQTKFYYYNYTESKGVALMDNIDTLVWQSNNRILYKYYDPKTKARTISVADPDGSNWSKITDLTYKDVVIAPIPKTGLISFWNAADAYAATSFQSVSVIGGEKKDIFKNYFGADYLWSPDGNNVLVSHSEATPGSKTQVGVANDNGGEYKNLDMPTFVSKCAWSLDNKTVYYALPGQIPDGMVLPNDYNESKFNTIDTFWKVDITTGKKDRIIDPDALSKIGAIDATRLFLNANESALLFINRTDGKLYRIDL